MWPLFKIVIFFFFQNSKSPDERGYQLWAEIVTTLHFSLTFPTFPSPPTRKNKSFQAPGRTYAPSPSHERFSVLGIICPTRSVASYLAIVYMRLVQWEFIFMGRR